MNSSEAKKIWILYVLKILREKSDQQHPLTQSRIGDILKNEYGIDIERKAISRNISVLKDAGYEIKKTPDGCYLENRDFEDSELRLLIDAVLGSKHIPPGFSKDLIKKLVSLSGPSFQSRVHHIYAKTDWEKTDNKQLFLNIDIIDEAIATKKQIRFDYYKYGPDKKLHKTSTNYGSPYQLILHNQRYYLMMWDHHMNQMHFLRLDRIRDITIREKAAIPVKMIPGYANGIDYGALVTSLPYMYGDQPEYVTFLARREIVDQVVDWFGKRANIEQYDAEQFKITVKASLKAMRHWIMQYTPRVRVLSPQKLVDDIRRDLEAGLKAYD